MQLDASGQAWMIGYRENQGPAWSSGLSWTTPDAYLAERAGFEPAIRFNPYTRFPGVRLQPLGHLSCK